MSYAPKQGIRINPKLLILLGVAVVAGAAVWYFMVRVSAPVVAPVTVPAEKLDVSILRDPRFEALVMPNGAVLAPDASRFGRPNPFAPVTAENVASVTMTPTPVEPAVVAPIPENPMTTSTGI
jgi:hypothetical protein